MHREGIDMYSAQLSKNALDAHFPGAMAGRKAAGADATRWLWDRTDRAPRTLATPVVFIVSNDLTARAALETASTAPDGEPRSWPPSRSGWPRPAVRFRAVWCSTSILRQLAA